MTGQVEELCPLERAVRYYHYQVALIHECTCLHLNDIEEPFGLDHAASDLLGLGNIQIEQLLDLFVFFVRRLHPVRVHQTLFESEFAPKYPGSVYDLAILMTEILVLLGDALIGLEADVHRLAIVANVRSLLNLVLHNGRQQHRLLHGVCPLGLQGQTTYLSSSSFGGIKRLGSPKESATAEGHL